MVDHLTVQDRSNLMGKVRGTDTGPELFVRRLLHRRGFRYRLHRSDLPGKPDLVFPSRKKIILVNGCYWHRHSCRRGRSVPHSNTETWVAKFEENVRRDRRIKAELEESGWAVFVVWECQARPSNSAALALELEEFLQS